MIAAIANALIWVFLGFLVLLGLYIIARVISRAVTKSYLETMDEHTQDHAKRIVREFQEKLSKDYPTKEIDE
jgi:cytochrome c-type biogenesis protein CcmH/NrfF